MSPVLMALSIGAITLAALSAAYALRFVRRTLIELREIHEKDLQSAAVAEKCAEWGLFKSNVYTDDKGESWLCVGLSLVDKYDTPIGHMIPYVAEDVVWDCDSEYAYYIPELGLIHLSNGDSRTLCTGMAPLVPWDELTPAEARRLWAIALRSGVWEQGIRKLRRGSCFCFMGVAHDIIYPYSWRTRGEGLTPDGQDYFARCSHGNAYSIPPKETAQQYGMANNGLGMGESLFDHREHLSATEETLLSYFDSVNACNLIALNDRGLFQFSDFADLIEDPPRGIFTDHAFA